MKRLFVYGSLRSSGSAHHLLDGAVRESNGIADGFICTSHNGYPMLIRGNGSIEGEVYRVPETAWPDLDNWEEVPEVYRRSQVTLQDGRAVWLYEAAKDSAAV